jgi:hypothetical protein
MIALIYECRIRHNLEDRKESIHATYGGPDYEFIMQKGPVVILRL